MVEMKPITRMTKKELKETLLSLEYTEEQLLDSNNKKLNRAMLLQKLRDHQKGEKCLTILNDLKEDENDVGVAIVQDAKENAEETKQAVLNEPSSPNDPGWTQFVLGKLLDDEVDGKNPRVEGLRRIAGELIGELIEEGCDLVAVPTEENRFRACAKAWAVFLTPDGLQKRFEALADAHSDNCLEDYATYLVAMADTRAKGRVYRNALRLKRTVAAEEVNKTVAISEDIKQGGPIHTSQISMIRLMSDRYHFNIEKILDSIQVEYSLNEQTGDVNLQSLSYEDALRTAKAMREKKEEGAINDNK